MHFYCQLLKWNTIPSWLKLWIHNTTQNHHNLIQQPVNIVNNRYYSLCKIWNNLLNSLPLVSHGCERINGKCHCKNNESNIIMFVVTSGHGPLALPETMSIISRLRPPHPSGGTPSYVLTMVVVGGGICYLDTVNHWRICAYGSGWGNFFPNQVLFSWYLLFFSGNAKAKGPPPAPTK